MVNPTASPNEQEAKDPRSYERAVEWANTPHEKWVDVRSKFNLARLVEQIDANNEERAK